MDVVRVRRPRIHASRTACCVKPRQFRVKWAPDTNTPLDFIVVDDELFFQHFDGIQVVRLLLFGKHDFTEVTLTQDSKEVKVVQTDFPLSSASFLDLLLLLLLWRLLLLYGRRG